MSHSFVAILLVGLITSSQNLFAQKAPAPKPTPKKIMTITGDPVSPPPPAPATKKPKEPNTFGIKVERYVSNTTVARDGTSVKVIDWTYRFTNPVGLARMKKFGREFNRDLLDVSYSDLYVLKADGKRIDLKPEAVTKRRTPQAEAAPSYSSMMEATIDFGNVAVGDAVNLRMTVTESRVHFAGNFDLFEVLSELFEWNGAEVTVTGPADLELFTDVQGLTGGLLGTENGRRTWKWTMPKTPAVEMEVAMPPFSEKTPRVLATTFRDHASLGAAYWKEASKMSEITPAIQAKADEITKGIETPDEQAAAIYIWVNKNIRYLSLVVDRSGWIPNKASEILANGYGDCKDYTTLIYTMLKAKGIDSQPVLIRSEFGDWFPSVATPAYFNHAILYIPSLDMFADATAPNTRLGLISQEIIGKKALLAGTRNEVITTHGDKPDRNLLLSVADVSVEINGDVKVNVSNTYTGTFEMILRPLLGEDSSVAEMLVPIMLSMFGLDGHGKVTKVTDTFRVKEPFTVSADVVLPRYTTIGRSGTFRTPDGSNLVSSPMLGAYFLKEERINDLILGSGRIKETFRVKLPEGVTVDPASFSERSATNGIVTVKAIVKLNGNIIEIDREFVTHREIIRAQDYVATRGLVTKAMETFHPELKYTSANLNVKGPEASVRRAPASPKDALERLFESQIAKYDSVTAAEAKRLEAKLVTNPDDTESRSKLMTFYSDIFRQKNTRTKVSTTISPLAKHRIWFIENKPELGDSDFFAFALSYIKPNSADHIAIKNAWNRQLDSNTDNVRVIVNAAQFLEKTEPTKDSAKKLLEDAATRLPNELPLFVALQNIYHEPEVWTSSEGETPEFPRLRKEVEFGQRALALLKSERSTARDAVRRSLLLDIG
ncbi:MAG TPA: DUF3857 domain-containing protein, partial [Pyrinomonadaceae bacterium]|nr:DUF3857 domain-containing protein [Pyrinomonadaceae bacterium]